MISNRPPLERQLMEDGILLGRWREGDRQIALAQDVDRLRAELVLVVAA
jgi:hypothetical protein